MTEDISMLLTRISYYKNTGNLDKTYLKVPVEWQPVFPELMAAYEQIRKQNHLIDFDDMVFECAVLLESNLQVRAYWQNRFTHIFTTSILCSIVW